MNRPPPTFSWASSIGWIAVRSDGFASSISISTCFGTGREELGSVTCLFEWGVASPASGAATILLASRAAGKMNERMVATSCGDNLKTKNSGGISLQMDKWQLGHDFYSGRETDIYRAGTEWFHSISHGQYQRFVDLARWLAWETWSATISEDRDFKKHWVSWDLDSCSSQFRLYGQNPTLN